MPLTIHINPADNVVVALHPIARGTAVDLPDLDALNAQVDAVNGLV